MTRLLLFSLMLASALSAADDLGNLFDINRLSQQVLDVDKRQQANKKANTNLQNNEITLVGIIQNGDDYWAILSEARRQYHVGVGDVLSDETKVQLIDARGITLSDGKRLKLSK